MSLSPMTVIGRPSSFPRVSGDEPDMATQLVADLTFSPRERG